MYQAKPLNGRTPPTIKAYLDWLPKLAEAARNDTSGGPALPNATTDNDAIRIGNAQSWSHKWLD